MYYQNSLREILKKINKDSCPYLCNFHCHTTYSDGSLNPLELFNQANEIGLEHLAITDHHSKQAYIDIINMIKSNKYNFNTNLWTGIEITGILSGCMIHILALDFDINSSILDLYTSGDSVNGKDLEAEVIVETIKKANGLSILAHPARYRYPFNILIKQANEVGFDGVETWYDYERNKIWMSTPFVCEKIKNIASNYKMLMTCGTDTHGLSLLTR